MSSLCFISGVPQEILRHIFSFLPDLEHPKNAKVCRAWQSLAQSMHRNSFRSLFDRLIQMIPPEEWAAKTGIEKLALLSSRDFYDGCLCKTVKLMIRSHQDEINTIVAQNSESKKLYTNDLIEEKNLEANPMQLKTDFSRCLCISSSSIGFENPDTFDIEKFKALEQRIQDYNEGKIVLKKTDATRTNHMHLFSSDGKSKIIRCSGAGLTRIPRNFADSDKYKMHRITMLSFSDNYLHHLPHAVGQIQSIQKLFLKNNRFVLFPKAVLHLRALTDLNVSKNPLHSIPSEIEQLSRLKNLDLSFTKMSGLPEEIVNLKNLQSLVLAGTSIRRFPPKIMNSDHFICIQSLLPHLFAEIALHIHSHQYAEITKLLHLLPKEWKNILLKECQKTPSSSKKLNWSLDNISDKELLTGMSLVLSQFFIEQALKFTGVRDLDKHAVLPPATYHRDLPLLIDVAADDKYRDFRSLKDAFSSSLHLVKKVEEQIALLKLEPDLLSARQKQLDFNVSEHDPAYLDLFKMAIFHLLSRNFRHFVPKQHPLFRKI